MPDYGNMEEIRTRASATRKPTPNEEARAHAKNFLTAAIANYQVGNIEIASAAATIALAIMAVDVV